MPEGVEREELTMLVAGQMKRSLGNWNKDAMDDDKVALDLDHYTHGSVHLDKERFHLFFDQYDKVQPGRAPVAYRKCWAEEQTEKLSGGSVCMASFIIEGGRRLTGEIVPQARRTKPCR